MTLDAHGNARRRLLLLGAGLASGLAANGVLPREAHANIAPLRRPDRSLTFHNLHTGERLQATYWSDGHYVPSGQQEIDWILRDFRVNEVHHIDPAVLDLLHALQRRLERHNPFEVISGYRSPHTNAMLAARSEGVAKHSLHMQGKAIDIRMRGVPLLTLHRAAVSLRAGGVGLYRTSDFVHVDVGRVRYW